MRKNQWRMTDIPNASPLAMDTPVLWKWTKCSLLTLLIKLADCYDIPLEVNLVEKAPLGYWICISFKDANQFYKMFQDVDFYEKWDKMSLNDIILNMLGMPLDTHASEIKKVLDQHTEEL